MMKPKKPTPNVYFVILPTSKAMVLFDFFMNDRYIILFCLYYILILLSIENESFYLMF
jgi:hypothetical protein